MAFPTPPKERENRKAEQVLSGVGTSGRGGYKERVQEGECGGNIVYSCMKMKK
jgi:hypothetical protein